MTSTPPCALCGERIGPAAPVIYRDRRMVHLACVARVIRPEETGRAANRPVPRRAARRRAAPRRVKRPARRS